MTTIMEDIEASLRKKDGIKWVFVDKNGYIVYKLDMIKNKQRIKELLGGTELSLEHVEEEISKMFLDFPS